MNITPKKQKRSRKIIAVIVAILVLVAIAGISLHTAKQNGLFAPKTDDTSLEAAPVNNSDPKSPPTQEQIDAGNTKKEQSVESSAPPQTDTLTLDLTAFKKSTDITHVGINITNKVTSAGSCSLELTKGSSVKNYSSDIIAVTSYSTCKGFDIQSLDAGKWIIKVTVTSGSEAGSATGEVQV